MRRGWVVAAVILAAACGEDERRADAGERRGGDAELGGQVASTVDGVAIEVAEVREVSRETGLAPAEALRRLQDREVLAAEARRRGYASHPEVILAAKRAAVQALLAREIEAAVPPESFPEEVVRERWQANEEYHRPERRRVSHVLARLPDEAGDAEDAVSRRLAGEAAAALRAATEVEAVLAEYRGTERDGLTLVVEELPPMAAEDPYQEPFKDAVFALEGPGVVAEPVRTSYGWHAIVVHEITPALEVPFEQAEEEVRRAMAVERRRERLDSFLETLADRYPVEREAETIDRVLSQDLLTAQGNGTEGEGEP